MSKKVSDQLLDDMDDLAGLVTIVIKFALAFWFLYFLFGFR